jgi:hypothetical protein
MGWEEHKKDQTLGVETNHLHKVLLEDTIVNKANSCVPEREVPVESIWPFLEPDLQMWDTPGNNQARSPIQRTPGFYSGILVTIFLTVASDFLGSLWHIVEETFNNTA